MLLLLLRPRFLLLLLLLLLHVSVELTKVDGFVLLARDVSTVSRRWCWRHGSVLPSASTDSLSRIQLTNISPLHMGLGIVSDASCSVTPNSHNQSQLSNSSSWFSEWLNFARRHRPHVTVAANDSNLTVRLEIAPLKEGGNISHPQLIGSSSFSWSGAFNRLLSVQQQYLPSRSHSDNTKSNLTANRSNSSSLSTSPERWYLSRLIDSLITIDIAKSIQSRHTENRTIISGIDTDDMDMNIDIHKESENEIDDNEVDAVKSQESHSIDHKAQQTARWKRYHTLRHSIVSNDMMPLDTQDKENNPLDLVSALEAVLVEEDAEVIEWRRQHHKKSKSLPPSYNMTNEILTSFCNDTVLLNALCDRLELPHRLLHRWFAPLSTRTVALCQQRSVLSLLLRVMRSGMDCTQELQSNRRLMMAFDTILRYESTGAMEAVMPWSRSAPARGRGFPHRVHAFLHNTANFSSNQTRFAAWSQSISTSLSSPPIYVSPLPSVSYRSMADELSNPEMARITSAALGGQLRLKQPRKGLRILALDGGGTRGVLTIALLKEIFSRIDREPCDVFDIICGTSTGGILAVLLATHQSSLLQTESLYDSLIAQIFATKSGFKFVRSQAFYDERVFETLLDSLCGDELLIDSRADSRVPLCFAVSSKMHLYSPPQVHLWRNYQLPRWTTRAVNNKRLDGQHRPDHDPQEVTFDGHFAVPAKTAIRATTAAPTIFTPVSLEHSLYCDGALTANNPSAIAVQEAKRLFPNTPIDCLLSVGTGNLIERSTADSTSVQSLAIDTLLHQLIAATTDTEHVHRTLHTLLPASNYFRFNPLLPRNIPIDAKSHAVLTELKALGRHSFEVMMRSDQGSSLLTLLHKLKQ